jgi:hypothetical protein
MMPIDGVERELDDFCAAKAVRRHQQQHRKVSFPRRFVPRHGAQDAPDVRPRQRPRWTIRLISRRPHGFNDVAPDPARQMEKAEQRSERTTAFYHRACRDCASLSLNEGVEIGRRDLPQQPVAASHEA